MTGAEDLLEDAARLSEELGLGGMAAMLRAELADLHAATPRFLFVGPPSSGKTSSLLSLMRLAAYDEAGESILPVGVAPTTAHIVEVRAGSSEVSAVVRWRDGRTESTGSMTQLRAMLARPDGEVHRVLVEVPTLAGLSEPLVCIDAPGVGGVGGGYADELLEESLGISDRIFLHVRAPRGLGPARSVLERVRSRYPYPEELQFRLIPVLTDLRTPDRLPEILEGMREILGFETAPPVLVPKRGEVTDLETRIATALDDAKNHYDLDARARDVLRHGVLPVLGATLERHQARRARRDQSIEHARRFRAGALSTAAYIQQRSEEARAEARQGLEELARERVESAREDVAQLIETSDRFLFDSYKDEVARSLNHHLIEDFTPLAEERLLKIVTRMANDCQDRLDAFEQSLEVGGIPVEAPGLQELKATTGKRGIDFASRRFFLYLNRLGGNGGITLGTMNLGRKVVSKAYRAVGKRASQDLIRKGVPNAVRGLGKALKFVGERQWLILVALEVIPLVWGVARARPKLRNELEKMTHAWLHGPKKSMWQRIRGTDPPPGQLAQLSEAVRIAWEGSVVIDEAGRKTIQPGVEAQLIEALAGLHGFVADRDAELALWSNDVEAMDAATERYRVLRTRCYGTGG